MIKSSFDSTKFFSFWGNVSLSKSMSQLILVLFIDNGQEYEFQIAALNEIGLSENATEQLITPAGYPEGEPLNIRYTIAKNQVCELGAHLGGV